MTYEALEEHIINHRFDLSIEEIVEALEALHARPAADRRAHLTLHHELVEQCVEAAFDLFAGDALPSPVMDGVVIDAIADWPTMALHSGASVVATLQALSQQHPILARLEADATPAAAALRSRLLPAP